MGCSFSGGKEQHAPFSPLFPAMGTVLVMILDDKEFACMDDVAYSVSPGEIHCFLCLCFSILFIHFFTQPHLAFKKCFFTHLKAVHACVCVCSGKHLCTFFACFDNVLSVLSFFSTQK